MPITFGDDDIVVLQKPPGLAVHKGPLVDHSAADALARELPVEVTAAHEPDFVRMFPKLRARPAQLGLGSWSAEPIAFVSNRSP